MPAGKSSERPTSRRGSGRPAGPRPRVIRSGATKASPAKARPTKGSATKGSDTKGSDTKGSGNKGSGKPSPAKRSAVGKSGAAVRRATPTPGGATAAGLAARPKWTTRAAVLAVVLVALIASYAGTLRNWIDQRQQLSQLRQENQDRTAAVADLQYQVRRWDDPAFVESQARSRFGWVMPGEVGYVVIDDTGKPATAKPKSAAKSGRDQTPWWTELRSSIASADRSTGTGTTPGRPSPTPAPEKTIGPDDDG